MIKMEKLKFYTFYYQNIYLKSYVASSKKAAIKMIKKDKLKFDRLVIQK
jgi:hypothetical protein